jgi:eukaryotic-like serine/threonine-protein kinase
MICPKCHSENRDAAKFCDECGARLPQFDTLTNLPTLVGELPAIKPSASGSIADLPEVDASSEDAVVEDGATEAPAISKPSIENSADDASDTSESSCAGHGEPIDKEDASFSTGEALELAGDAEIPDDANGSESDEQAASVKASDDSGNYDFSIPDFDTADIEAAEANAESVIGKWNRFEDAEGISAQSQKTGELDEERLRLLALESSKTSLIDKPEDKKSRADLSGFDEYLVDSDYVKPTPAYRNGDTMQMPPVGGAAAAASVSFVAPDPNDKKKRKRGKKADKASRAARETSTEQGKSAVKDDAAASASGSAATDSSKEKPAEKKPLSKGAKCGIGIAVFCVLVCAIAAGVTYHFEMWGGKVVPDVSGMTQTDAAYLLQNKGFTVRTTKVASDSTEGIVLLMDPGAGSRQAEGSEIVVHVSTSRIVPDVLGKSEDEARSLFNDNGFTNVTYVMEKSDEAEGSVLSTDPEAGAKAKAATSITVTVAEPYKVPDVSGMMVEEAVRAIEDEGLVAKKTFEYNESVSPGTLLGVSPEAGSKVTSGSEVVVRVSKSRASELTSAAYSYLANAALQATDGSTFNVSSVDSCTYQGNNTVTFAATGRATTSVSVLGQTISVSGDSKQVSGTLTFDANNNVTAVSFK